jgi:hypothetical protein
MAGTLATPTFVSGANDSVATEDVYQKITGVPVNSVPAQSSVTNTDLVGDLRGNGSMKTAASSVKPAVASASTNSQDVLSRIDGSFAGPLSSATSSAGTLFSKVPSTVAGSVLKDVSPYTNVNYIVNGVRGKVAASNFGILAPILNGVGSLGCPNNNLGIFDKDALRQSLLGLLLAALAAGLRNLLGAFTCLMPDVSTFNTYAKDAIKPVLHYADLGSLTTLAQNTSPGYINSVNPNTTSDFSKNFAYQQPPSTSDLNSTYSQVHSTYNTINPSWNSTPLHSTAGTENALNLTPVLNGSNDFQHTFATCGANSPDPDQQLYALSGSYMPANPTGDLQTHFPSTYLASTSDNSTLLNKTVDPVSAANSGKVYSTIASNTTSYSSPNDAVIQPVAGVPNVQTFSLDNGQTRKVTTLIDPKTGNKTVTTDIKYADKSSTRVMTYNPSGAVVSDQLLAA